MEHDDRMTDRMWKLAQGKADDDLTAHLATCASCREEFGTLQALATYQATTAGGFTAVPESVIVSAVGLFRRVRPDLVMEPQLVVEQVTGVVRRLVAQLILDTGTEALAGVRSDTDRQTRQLAFVSDLGDLDLMVTSRDAFSEVSGQLGMDELPDGLVMHFTPAAPTPDVEPVTTPLAANGRFETTLRRGEWLAWVQIGDAILEFPGVQV